MQRVQHANIARHTSGCGVLYPDTFLPSPHTRLHTHTSICHVHWGRWARSACLLLPLETVLGWLVPTDGSSPLCSILNCLYPVGYASKVVVNQVIPTKRRSTSRSLLSTWSTPHELSLGTMGWHPPHMSEPLKPSLLQPVRHWQLPVFCRMVVFCILSHKVTPRMSWRHLIWNVFSFLRSGFDTFQVSAPYSKTGITNVRKAHSLVSLLRLWLLNTFHLHIWYTTPAFSSLASTSYSTLPSCPTSLPR